MSLFPETGNPVNKPPNQNGDDWDSVDAAKQPDDGDDGEPQKNLSDSYLFLGTRDMYPSIPDTIEYTHAVGKCHCIT